MNEQREPSEEELRQALEEELRRIKVSDVLLQTVVSLINLAGRRAGLTGEAGEETDPAQVQAAIDGVQALLPVLERHGLAGAEELRPIRDALAQLQLAYTRMTAAGTPAAGEPAAEGAEPAAGAQAGDEGDSPGPGPAQSSGRLWTPGQ